MADLATIADGLRAAEADGPVIARSRPAFAASLTGTAATGARAAPAGGAACWSSAARSSRTTTAQLAALAGGPARALTVEADVRGARRPGGEDEVERLAAAARPLLASPAAGRRRDAPRRATRRLLDAESQQRIAHALAQVAALRRRPAWSSPRAA